MKPGFRIKKPKPVSRKATVKRLDAVFSKFIRQRDKRCVQCGTMENLTCGHVFSRVNYSTRWDENNCYAQCMGCNLRHEYEPYPFYQWTIKKLGQEAFDELYVKHAKVKKYSTYDLLELIKVYSKAINL